MRTMWACARGLVLAIFGFFCLNYTKAFGVEHHYEWASEHDLPAPSGWIYFLGVACLALGSAAVGHALARSRPPR